MRRRKFIGILTGAVLPISWSVTAHAHLAPRPRLLFAMGRCGFLGTLGGAGSTFSRMGLLAFAAALSISLASLEGMAQGAAKIHRIGLLSADSNLPHDVAFLEGLRSLGYTEGQNYTILRRSAQGQPDRLSRLAEELVHEKSTSSSVPALSRQQQ